MGKSGKLFLVGEFLLPTTTAAAAAKAARDYQPWLNERYLRLFLFPSPCTSLQRSSSSSSSSSSLSSSSSSLLLLLPQLVHVGRSKSFCLSLFGPFLFGKGGSRTQATLKRCAVVVAAAAVAAAAVVVVVAATDVAAVVAVVVAVVVVAVLCAPTAKKRKCSRDSC